MNVDTHPDTNRKKRYRARQRVPGGRLIGPWRETEELARAENLTGTTTVERPPTTRGYTPDIALDGTMDETDADEGQDRQGSKATGAHGRYRQYLYDLGWRNIDVKVTYDKRDLLGSAAVIAMETPHGEPRTIIASAVEVPVKVVDYAWNTLGVNILHLRWKDEA